MIATRERLQIAMPLKPYQREFIEFAIRHGALRFGEFTLKSGRSSPYFFNAGTIASGAALARLGSFYAAAIADAGFSYDMLFGPAYKGIPLATAIAIALAQSSALDPPVAFNRKEAKDHGEGGRLLGAPIAGRVLIVDDVITAGISVRESVEMIRAAGGTPAGVIIALDRQERDQDGQHSAVQAVASRHGIQVASILRLDDLIQFAGQAPTMAAHLERIAAYRERYGAP